MPAAITSGHLAATPTPSIPVAAPTATTGTPANAAATALANMPKTTPATTSTATATAAKPAATTTSTTTPTTTPATAPVAPTETLTPAEQAAQGNAETLSQGISTSEGELAGQAADTTAAINAAGVPQMTAQLTSLNNTITTLTANLATFDTQNAQIQQNISQQPVAMSIITGQQAAQQAQSAITRASMVSEIGMYNAQVQATQGNITLATQTATQAVAAKYAPIQEQIQIQQAQLTALQPILTSAEAKIAANQSIALTQYNNQVSAAADLQKQIATLAVNAAGYGANANTVAKINSATTLAGALSAASGYVSDPLAKQLTETTIAKNVADINAEDQATSAANISNVISTLPTFNGQPYYTATQLTGMTAQEKAAFQATAAAQGIKVLTPKDSDALSTITSAQSNLQDFNTFITTSGSGGTPIMPKNFFGQPLQAANVTLQKYLQTNDQLSAYNAWSAQAIQLLGGLKGVASGGGGAARLLSTVTTTMLPQATDTLAVAQTKIATLNTLLANSGAGITGAPAGSSGTQSMYAGITLPSTGASSTFAGVTLPN